MPNISIIFLFRNAPFKVALKWRLLGLLVFSIFFSYEDAALRFSADGCSIGFAFQIAQFGELRDEIKDPIGAR